MMGSTVGTLRLGTIFSRILPINPNVKNGNRRDVGMRHSRKSSVVY